MRTIRAKNLQVLALAGVVIAVMAGLVVYAPTLYQVFCDLTGYGGTVRRAAAPQPAAAETGRAVTVLFNAHVDPGLPWTFRPEQRQVLARPDEPARAYYYARNDSDETVVARAVFNVTPYKAAPYFFKVECFCFTEEKLAPGESARMPLVFFLDREMFKDDDTSEVRQVTLSYTFYRQEDLSPEEIESARDLKAGSQALDARLKRRGTAEFDNDAPRR